MFDKKLYKEILKSDDWYLQLSDFLKEHFFEFNTNRIGKPREWYKESEEFEQLVLDCLNESLIPLNQNKLGLDRLRNPIDTIIIHHSGRQPEEVIERGGEALSLIRLYAKDFSDPRNRYYGKAITSDHIYNDRITFLPYHYVIWPDGKFVNYLKDEYVAWHAGGNFNLSSIAICFHSELENDAPTDEAISAAREIISKYKDVKILGHREVSSTTTCPGSRFLGVDGWKERLL